MKGVQERREREQRDLAWHAWHVASLPMMKKFPALKDFLGAGTKPDLRRKTPEEMQAVAQQWHAVIQRMH